MKGAVRGSAAILLLAASWAAVAAEADPNSLTPRAPLELTRSVQALQDQMAFGSDAARSAQRALLIHVGEQFAAADRDVWREPANARAAILYVLSGGRPQFLRELIDEAVLHEDHMGLARGALAYAGGRRLEAWSHFQDIDARDLPPLLGAHIALVQASLRMEADPEAAIGYLGTARLLAPGTLIEEAALRRQLTAASALADEESFHFLASQYFRRFSRSAYATNLYRSFPDLWAKLGLPNDERFAKLEATLSDLDPRNRLQLFLALAFRGLVAGDLEATRFSAESASKLSDAGSPEAVRAALYAAAAQAPGAQSGASVAALQGIDPTSLSTMDAELRAAALAVAAQVQEHTGPARARPFDGGDFEVSAVIERARDALAAADALIERSR